MRGIREGGLALVSFVLGTGEGVELQGKGGSERAGCVPLTHLSLAYPRQLKWLRGANCNLPTPRWPALSFSQNLELEDNSKQVGVSARGGPQAPVKRISQVGRLVVPVLHLGQPRGTQQLQGAK